MNSSYKVDWDNATVLDHSDFFPRLYLESWYIDQQDNTMNRGLEFNLTYTEA